MGLILILNEIIVWFRRVGRRPIENICKILNSKNLYFKQSYIYKRITYSEAFVIELDSILCDINVLSTSEDVIIEIESQLFDCLSGINISGGGINLYINYNICYFWDKDESNFDVVEINE